MNRKFQVGDKVRYVHAVNDMVGIVVHIDCVELYYGVDFGDGFEGHNLNGMLDNKHGWWCCESDLEFYSDDDEITEFEDGDLECFL